MISKWTQHLTNPEEKQRFEQSILGARHVLERLGQIVDEELSNLDQKECNVKVFEQPNWEYRQAHMLGYRAFARVMKTILDLGDDNDRTKFTRPGV